MRVVFMGTPDFAVPSLKALHEAGHEIPLVITKPDAVRGRGKKIQFPPVKECAVGLGIPVEQPEKIKNNGALLEKLRDIAPDAIAVAAYGKILPAEILNLPPLGCINVHGSLLPRFRGAAPVQWTILAGDEYGGVTIMQMAEGLDTGDMLAAVKTPVLRKTAGELSLELSQTGAKLLVETLREIEGGRVTPEKQDDTLATYAPMLTKRDGLMNFNRSSRELECQIRGLAPWPGTFTYLDGELFKIWAAEALPESPEKAAGIPVAGEDAAPGTVTAVSEDGITVACGSGSLVLKEVQAPGKKRMSAGDYLRGNHIEISTVLG